jgi:hypothetical protein
MCPSSRRRALHWALRSSLRPPTGIASLLDLHFGRSEGRFDARSLLHEVAKWPYDAGRQDKSCRILLRTVIDAGQYTRDRLLGKR